jgi:aspartyl-tRNA(Asn)/glutamyl-tRNA(Gln) amidotransferase subunit A
MESIEHFGPLARSVADAALMLSVMAGPDPRDRWSLPGGDVDWCASAMAVERLGLKVACGPRWEDGPAMPAVRALCDRAAATFEAMGCEVGAARRTGGRQEFTDALSKRKRAVEAIMPDAALRPDADAGGAAVAVRDRSRRARHDRWPAGRGRLLDAGDVPVQHHRPAGDQRAGGLDRDDGLPVGLQIVGRHLADGTALRAAAAFEQASPWAHRFPPVSVKRSNR